MDLKWFEELEARIPHDGVRTRFAPSPTGYMHVGNLRTALYTWLIARHSQGTFILRIEDTDQTRQVEGATEVIYRTLAECHLDHDEGPDVGGPVAPYIQTQRRDTYGKYARLLVEKGGSKGVIAPQETTFIQNVFEFNDLTVEEFATHRTDVCHLCLDEPQEAWETTIHDSRHSRYPVCESTVDQVVGILDAKRYFRLSDKSRESVMQHAVTPPWFIPETVRADVLFKQMQHSRNHFAVVLDEYGGMAGIVTMSDLLEQLVGDLDDSAEHEPVLPEIEPLDSGTWRILGSAPLAHVAKALHVNLPVKEYDTFGGFVFACYGFVPEDGAEFELDACGLHIHVTQIQGHKLQRAVVCRETPPPDP